MCFHPNRQPGDVPSDIIWLSLALTTTHHGFIGFPDILGFLGFFGFFGFLEFFGFFGFLGFLGFFGFLGFIGFLCCI